MQCRVAQCLVNSSVRKARAFITKLLRQHLIHHTVIYDQFTISYFALTVANGRSIQDMSANSTPLLWNRQKNLKDWRFLRAHVSDMLCVKCHSLTPNCIWGYWDWLPLGALRNYSLLSCRIHHHGIINIALIFFTRVIYVRGVLLCCGIMRRDESRLYKSHLWHVSCINLFCGTIILQ